MLLQFLHNDCKTYKQHHGVWGRKHDVNVRILFYYEHPGRGMTFDKVKWFEESETLLLFPAATY